MDYYSKKIIICNIWHGIVTVNFEIRSQGGKNGSLICIILDLVDAICNLNWFRGQRSTWACRKCKSREWTTLNKAKPFHLRSLLCFNIRYVTYLDFIYKSSVSQIPYSYIFIIRWRHKLIIPFHEFDRINSPAMAIRQC